MNTIKNRYDFILLDYFLLLQFDNFLLKKKVLFLSEHLNDCLFTVSHQLFSTIFKFTELRWVSSRIVLLSLVDFQLRLLESFFRQLDRFSAKLTNL